MQPLEREVWEREWDRVWAIILAAAMKRANVAKSEEDTSTPSD